MESRRRLQIIKLIHNDINVLHSQKNVKDIFKKVKVFPKNI